MRFRCHGSEAYGLPTVESVHFCTRRDWSAHESVRDRDELLQQYLDDARCLDDEIVENAIAAAISVETSTKTELEALRPPSKLDRALEQVRDEIGRVFPALAPEDVKKVQNRLRNSGKFIKLFR